MKRLEECKLLCYTDASWANLPDEGSQGGMVILLEDTLGRKCPIHWQTKKIRRVVKSTLAAEALALLDGAEEATHISSLISELFNVKKLEIKCLVDNKGLVEALYSNKQVEGKRLRVEIAALKEMIETQEIAGVDWVPSFQPQLN